MDTIETIEVNPELLLQYIGLNKNAIILHMAIKAVAEDGKLQRNIKRFSRLTKRDEKRLREAEGELKRKELLAIHWNGDKRFWYVYDRPTRPQAVLPVVVPVVETENLNDENPPPKSLWRRIKEALTGDELDYELTKSQP
jgi:hypothetical protein